MSSLPKLSPHITYGGIAILLFVFVPLLVWAQEADTTKKEIKSAKRNLHLQRQLDRSVSGGKMTRMGSYDVPTETQYYQRPFKGQKYLDEAVKAYRENIKNSWEDNWYWQFLKTVSPYINNTFEFGFYNTDVPFVDRDNPLFQSYKSKEKRQ